VRLVSAKFSASDRLAMRPSSLRSSGTKPILAATALATLPVCTVRPVTEIAPTASGMRPKIALASVERPLPTRPARPTISPG
jgi:hypothetical protein